MAGSIPARATRICSALGSWKLIPASMPALATVREPARRQLLGCRPLAGNAPAVALGDQLEQYAGLGLIFADIAEVVEDQAVELVELGEGRRQGEIAPRSLQFL